MKKNIFRFTLYALLFALCVPAQAQQPGKLFRIGYLDESTSSGSVSLLEAFRQRLHMLGWVDKKNITFEYRFGEGTRERLPELAAELVRLGVDVLVVRGNIAAQAAKQATSTIPIVMVTGTDPVAAGFVASLAKPSGNITGLVSPPPGLMGKRFELLKEALPQLSRVGVLAPTGTAEQQIKEIIAIAPSVKATVQELMVRREPNGFDEAFQTAVQKRLDAIITVSNPFLFGERRRIVELAAKKRLPAMYHQSAFTEVGGLMSYGTDVVDLYRRAAVFVDKILKGVKPADLPVEYPTKFELVINLKTAKQIGLTMPQSVLYRADKVIK
jgi:putative tryptophan/tyrosine transport system substrate-binding protein